MMVRFATLCDVCGKRSQEYASWPTCSECQLCVCPNCYVTGSHTEDERDEALCLACEREEQESLLQEHCGELAIVLGALGRLTWYRCRMCGIDFNVETPGLSLAEANESFPRWKKERTDETAREREGELPDDCNVSGCEKCASNETERERDERTWREDMSAGHDKTGDYAGNVQTYLEGVAQTHNGRPAPNRRPSEVHTLVPDTEESRAYAREYWEKRNAKRPVDWTDPEVMEAWLGERKGRE